MADPGPLGAPAHQHLIRDVERNGNDGIGKPEPLEHGFHGYWSRRITDEHRLVYKIVDDEIRLVACPYRYAASPPGRM